MKQRAEITFETEETVVRREGAKATSAFCSVSERDVLMATPQAAAFLSGVSERHIFRMLGADLLHFTEGGRVMICLESVRFLGEEV
jgi:hypothetical protein